MSIIVDGKELDDSRLAEIKHLLLKGGASPELIARAYGLTLEQLAKIKEML